MADRGSWRFYRRLLGAQVRSQAQYRTSFVIDLASQAAFSLADFAGVVVMFSMATVMGGFTLSQTLLITGLSAVGFATADLLVGNVERLKTYVRTGLLDAMLIRPRRVLPQLLVVDFELRRLGRVLIGGVVLGIGIGVNDVDWTWWRIAFVATAPLAATVFFSAVFVLTASVAFWWVDSGEFANAFTYGGKEFVSYPVSVYEGFFRNLFAFGLGFGFVAYYPALLLLNTPDPLGLPGWAGLGAYPVAALAATVAALVWRTGIRHYKGTGS